LLSPYWDQQHSVGVLSQSSQPVVTPGDDTACMSKQRNTTPRRQHRPNRRYRRLLPTAFATAALAAGATAAPAALGQTNDHRTVRPQMSAASGKAPSIPTRAPFTGR
jgi:hypothetical protein